jgi:hypothetical protein
LSEWKPIAIDLGFCYFSSCSVGNAAASVGIQFGVTCQNDSTNEGWYVTSPHLSLADFSAYAESIGLDLSESAHPALQSWSQKVFSCITEM